MNIDQLIHELDIRTRQLKRNLVTAEAQTIEDAKAKGIAFSSGPGAPAGSYARRRPNAAFYPGTINVRAGDFRREWATFASIGEGVLVHTLINASRVADFMKGTRLMITRPVLERVINTLEPARTNRIQSAIDNFCK